MTFHQSPYNELHKHFAILSEDIVLESEIKVEVDHENVIAEMGVARLKGIYGFTNKEERAKFVNRCNRTSELEVCFAV